VYLLPLHDDEGVDPSSIGRDAFDDRDEFSVSIWTRIKESSEMYEESKSASKVFSEV